MIFFTDENLPTRMAPLLNVFDSDNAFLALEGKFDKGTPDKVWMSTIAHWEEKPVVLSGDGRILKNQAERAILRECDLTFVYFTSGWMNADWPTHAWKIIKVWPAIVRNVSRA